jgi:hypothetical protein
MACGIAVDLDAVGSGAGDPSSTVRKRAGHRLEPRGICGQIAQLINDEALYQTRETKKSIRCGPPPRAARSFDARTQIERPGTRYRDHRPRARMVSSPP